MQTSGRTPARQTTDRKATDVRSFYLTYELRDITGRTVADGDTVGQTDGPLTYDVIQAWKASIEKQARGNSRVLFLSITALETGQ